MTVMVLELRAPQGHDLAALRPVVPGLVNYLLSFVYLGIYWNNHHHMFHAVQRVNGNILWANNHLLFWLSLVPFSTAWMAESHYAATPTAIYGATLLMNGLAYTILVRTILRFEGPDSKLAGALGSDIKGRLSLVIYALAILLALFAWPWMAWVLYAVVALMWLIPDPRIERHLAH